MRCSVIQFKTKCRLKENNVDGEILSFAFSLGPIRVICIANIPMEGEREAVVYVKLDFESSSPIGQWTQEQEPAGHSEGHLRSTRTAR